MKLQVRVARAYGPPTLVTVRFDRPLLEDLGPAASLATERLPVPHVRSHIASPVGSARIGGPAARRSPWHVADAAPHRPDSVSSAALPHQSRGRHRFPADGEMVNGRTTVLAEVTPKKRTVALREADAPRRRDASEAKPRPVTVAILPAHNEEEIISTAVRALMDQTAQPDRVIVASDNSTDSTVERGRAAGATVLETVGNDDKKAGALNQNLRSAAPDAR